VPIDAAFAVAGERLFLPCDPDGSFEETAGCRCFVEFAGAGEGLDTNEAETVEPRPIKRGDNAILTNDEIATIVFNETASLSGPDIEEARKAIANALINGDEVAGRRRPATAEAEVTRPLGTAVLPNGDLIVERQVLERIRETLIPAVRAEREDGMDRSGGNLFFGLRDAQNEEDFPRGIADVREKPRPIRDRAGNVVGTQPVAMVFGPFLNSAPDASQRLGTDEIYIVIFEGRTP